MMADKISSKILFIAALTAILFTVKSQSFCEQSEHVEDIPDLESCNGTGTVISVIYRPPSGTSNCSSIHKDLHILIFHHDFGKSITIEKHPPPERYNDTACLVHLTLSPDIFVKENNDTLMQVWMKLVSMPEVTYCSNNFTLQVDTDPPDPVNPTIHVGCNVVDVRWPVPFSPPGCPVRQYDIELNDEFFNITNTSLLHHSWSDLSPNMLNTLSISAVNDIGPSIQSNDTFITAINPQVLSLDYDVLLVDGNASLTIKAKVNDSCTYSVPTHLSYNASCDDDTVVTETRDVLNEQIFYQLPVPIDRLNCTACLIWSNLNSSLTFCNITFNTTQLLFIKLQPISNGLNFTCHYRPNSSLWGCGVLVNNSNRSVLSVNEAIGTVTDLCPGKYNVTNFYVKDGMDHVIEYVTVGINGTSCGTPTPSGSGDDDNSNLQLIIILLPSVLGPVILITIIIVIIIAVVVHKRRTTTGGYQMNGGKTCGREGAQPQTNGQFERSDPNCQPSSQSTEMKPNDKAKDREHSDPPITAPLTFETSFINSDSSATLKDEKEKETTQELSPSAEDKKASTNEGKSDISEGSAVNDIEHKSGSSNEAQGTVTTSSYVGGSNDVDLSQKGRVLSQNIGGDIVDDEAVYETEGHEEAADKQKANMDGFVSSATNKTSIKRSKSFNSNTETDQEKKHLLSTITEDSDAVHQDLDVPASTNDTGSQFVK